MDYGEAKEKVEEEMKWLERHARKFGTFVGGEFRFSPSPAFAPSVDPCTEEVLAECEQAGKEEVDQAVAAAAEAFKSWSALTGHERAKYLYAIARSMQRHHKLLAGIESLDNGKTIRESKNIDVPLAVRHFYHHAGWAQLQEQEFAGYRPLGVVACIIPWNFPLLMLSWKLAPALAMGNTVVLKPAPSTRLSAFLFCDILKEIGLPPGVVNVITGDNEMASYLVAHPAISKVAFTGSTSVGKQIRKQLAGRDVKLTMELGGKSAMIVLQDADLDACVEGCVDSIFMNQGQVCCAGSRLLVQEGVKDKLVTKLKERIERLRMGNSLDKNADMAAINNANQLRTISTFVDEGRKEGGEIFQSNLSFNPSKGYFFKPTLILGLQTCSSLSQDEIFGPVLVLHTFRTPEEACLLANNVRYGLAASIWTEKTCVAMEMAKKIRAGVVWINSHNVFDAAAGFGGCKESGFGREGGKEGIFEYLLPAWKGKVKQGKAERRDDGQEQGVGSNSKMSVSSEEFAQVDRTNKLFVGGKQVRSDSGLSVPVLSHNKELIGHVCNGSRKDIRDAVEAASSALSSWAAKPGHSRAQILYYLAENVSARARELEQRIMTMTGCSALEAKEEVNVSISRIFSFAAYADKYGGSVQETTLDGTVMAMHEAVGVVGIVCPSSHPLLSLMSLLAAALSRGNAVVIIPSERHPMIAADLYQILETSDVPPGVVNVVTGSKQPLALVLAEHRAVDSLWFFGSKDSIAKVESASADSMKRLFVEEESSRDWFTSTQETTLELLQAATHVKNVWIPHEM
uniref:Aldehyde dehydrogenase domain-containing protein n=1 Tax=Guillardia theta TaxID=55529 RepID=A0A7S4UTS9_GUITH